MKVLQINTTYKNGGSTGRIAYDLKQLCEQKGIDAYMAYGYEFSPLSERERRTVLRMCSIPQMQWSKLQTRLLANHGFYNVWETKRLLRWMDEIKPDVIHLHNLHNHYINVSLLFQYIKQKELPVVWTLHDCWPFTGWCAYFDMAHCDKWKTGCFQCPNKKEYPYTWFIDRSNKNWFEKQKVFCGVKDLVLVTPSQWLADLTRESFLCGYPVEVINNGVDIDVFKPTCNNGIREKYGIPAGKKIILAMMNVWGKRKGTDYLLQLPSRLKDDEILVAVGLKKKQLSLLPKYHCVGIERTTDVKDLAALYSVASVFINPTLEDNFPTTNIESLACGTPVITFRTGGSVESVDEGTGLVVEQGDLQDLLDAIQVVFGKGKEYYSKNCVERACLMYNKYVQYDKYIDLYKRALKGLA